MATPSDSPSTSIASQRPRGSYGSNVLWAHLLRKDVSPAPQPSLTSKSMASVIPSDRAGTSMRILLHDTQANLEKFSARVDKLTTGVEEAKREMVTMKTLFGEEHEKFMDQIVALVNRCQTTLQTSIGSPAQVSKVQDILDDLSAKGLKLESYDKKFDLIQMMIQTQMQTLQSIQDQQVQLLTSLAPILPLLQAIPAHIDAAKGDIKDVIRSISITPASPPGSTRLSGHPGRSQKKRSSSTLIAPEGHYVTPEGHYVALSESQSLSSSSPRKRPRAGDSSPTSPWRMDMNCSPSSDRSNRASSTRLRETYHSRSSLGPSSRRSTPQKTSSEAAHQSNIGHSSPIKSRDAQENLHQASDNIEVPRSNANILDLGRLAPSLPQEKPSQKSLRAVPRSSPAAPRRSSATSRSPPALHLADPEIVPESPCALPRLTDSALGTTPVIPFLQRVGSSSANTKLFGNLGSTVSYSVMKPSAVISSPGGALTPQINRRPTESRLIRSTPRRSGSLFSRGRPVLGQLNHPVPALGVSGRSKPKETGPSANFGTSPSSVAFSGLQASKRVSPEIPLSLKGCLASGPPGPPAGPPAWDLGTDERAVPVPTAPPSPTALFNSDDNVTLVSRAGNGQLTSVPLGNAQAMVSGKPMSLKDRKANETVVPNLKGKRFILVDDIDDEDDENSFGQW